MVVACPPAHFLLRCASASEEVSGSRGHCWGCKTRGRLSYEQETAEEFSLSFSASALGKKNAEAPRGVKREPKTRELFSSLPPPFTIRTWKGGRRHVVRGRRRLVNMYVSGNERRSVSGDQVIRENPASRGTETSADILVSK